MEKTTRKTGYVLLKQSLEIFLTIIASLALPQLFHALGTVTGQEGTFGQLFLPMYLPVLILALRTNAVLGVIAGFLSPLFSVAVSGMPSASLLPFITIELVCFGLFGGLLSNKSWHPFIKIVAVQIASRAVRIVATVIAVYAFGTPSVTAAAIFNGVLMAVPGFILQLLAVPYFMKTE